MTTPERPTSTPDRDHIVKLRDYVEALLAAERLYVDTRFNGIEAAGKLAAAELARRLEELNHAHDQAVSDRLVVVPREVFEKRAEIIDKEIASLQNWQARVVGVLIVLALLIPVVSVLLGRLIK